MCTITPNNAPASTPQSRHARLLGSADADSRGTRQLLLRKFFLPFGFARISHTIHQTHIFNIFYFSVVCFRNEDSQSSRNQLSTRDFRDFGVRSQPPFVAPGPLLLKVSSYMSQKIPILLQTSWHYNQAHCLKEMTIKMRSNFKTPLDLC